MVVGGCLSSVAEQWLLKQRPWVQLSAAPLFFLFAVSKVFGQLRPDYLSLDDLYWS